MPNFRRILCPVDLSENSLGAIELATALAKQQAAKIVFLYVSPLWLPKLPQTTKYVDQIVEEEKAKLYKLRPTDPLVEFEHQYINGNAGPTIVKATRTSDSVVMSTHGRSGVARFLMGSVAQFVLHNANCPVVLVKGMKLTPDETKNADEAKASQSYITDVMHSVVPVHSYEAMEAVLEGLTKARVTAAPVVDGSGKCIGILTTSDIDRFHSLQKRFHEKDETVIPEMFEVDEFGQRRSSNFNFDQVQRHMTKPVISLQDTNTIQDAVELFKAHPKIHHLVVLDEDSHAVGIVDASAVAGIKSSSRDKPSELEEVQRGKP